MAKEAQSMLKMDLEKAKETPMVELAYDLLKLTGKPLGFREIMDEVAKVREMTTEEINDYIALLYTEINIDGRFLCLGSNTWGLKRWYPVDKTTEKAADKKFIRKDDFEDDEDDDEIFLEEDFEEEDVVADDADLDEDDDFADADDVDEVDEELEEDFDDEESEDVEDEASEDEEKEEF